MFLVNSTQLPNDLRLCSHLPAQLQLFYLLQGREENRSIKKEVSPSNHPYGAAVYRIRKWCTLGHSSFYHKIFNLEVNIEDQFQKAEFIYENITRRHTQKKNLAVHDANTLHRHDRA